MAKYCNEHVGVYVCLSAYLSVCLSVREHIPRTTRAIFTNFLCMLPIAVARSSSGGVTKSQWGGTILGVFLAIDNALCGSYGGLDFATKDRLGLKIYSFTVKSKGIKFPIIKRHNCD